MVSHFSVKTIAPSHLTPSLSHASHSRFSPSPDPWYFGPERGSHRDTCAVDPEITYASRLDLILTAAKSGRVYARIQPWHLGPTYLTPSVLTLFQSSVLIRDPAHALPSFHKIKPDFTEEEAGYIGLLEAYKILVASGEDVPIVDALDIQRAPEAVVGAWCDAVAIPRNASALRWKEESHESWNSWSEYTATISASSGFLPPPDKAPDVPSERVAKLIDSARRQYSELHALRIVA